MGFLERLVGGPSGCGPGRPRPAEGWIEETQEEKVGSIGEEGSGLPRPWPTPEEGKKASSASASTLSGFPGTGEMGEEEPLPLPLPPPLPPPVPENVENEEDKRKECLLLVVMLELEEEDEAANLPRPLILVEFVSCEIASDEWLMQVWEGFNIPQSSASARG